MEKITKELVKELDKLKFFLRKNDVNCVKREADYATRIKN